MHTGSVPVTDVELQPRARDLLNLTEWLVGEECNSLDDAAFVASIGRRLHAAGLPVDRLVLHSVTLHPGFSDRAIAWSPGEPVEVREGDTAFRAVFPARSLSQVLEERRVLVVGAGEPAFPEWENSDVFSGRTLKQLVIAPLYNGDGPFSILAFGTRAPMGFSSADLTLLDRFTKPFRMVLELRLLRRSEFTLLDAYVGPPTPQKLLAGIIRGDEVEMIEGGLMLCDLADASALSRMGEPYAFQMLKKRLARMVQPIRRNGGMMIKMAGASIFAVFPAADTASACRAALDAATRELIYSGLMGEGEFGSLPAVVALHYGSVSYGNLSNEGSRELTLLGSDIELLSTIRDAARSLGEPIAMSRVFRDMAEVDDAASLHYWPKGSSVNHVIYGLRP